MRTAGPGARRNGLLVLLVVLLLTAAGIGAYRALDGGDGAAGRAAGGSPAGEPAGPRTGDRIIPRPAEARIGTGAAHRLTPATVLRAGVRGPADQQPEVRRITEQFAADLRRSTGLPLPVEPHDGEPGARPAGVLLALDPALPAETGAEGYRLTADATAVTIAARTPAGLYRGTQTLRQLLPPQVESRTTAPAGTVWEIAPVTVDDRPRYAHRGVLLDVARHFFTVDEVKGFIDRLALYKVNFLHLHLTDDQGWRLAIPGRPELTRIGAASEVGGTPGGHYTEADYRAIVRYAEERYLTVVPEIDLPGHTNAALAAYPELDCRNTRKPAPYTGIEVGFSLICPDDERTFAFTEEVIREVARLTPGPYLHVGGDEVKKLDAAGYREFGRRISAQVRAAGKEPVGWNQYAPAAAGDGFQLLQYWQGEEAQLKEAVARGARVVMSPAGRTYLDMKYHGLYDLGLRWAGTIDVSTAYRWDPDTELDLPAGAVRGIEAPLWTETLTNPAELDRMLLPRLPALAELGWSPRAAHDWEDFRQRLGTEGRRWEAAGYAYERRDQIPWR